MNKAMNTILDHPGYPVVYNCQTEELSLLIHQRLEEIGDFFLERNDFFPEIGIYGGESGTALLLAQFYLYKKESKYLAKLEEWINRLIELVNQESGSYPLFPHFSNGLAGFGWLMCYLKDNDIFDLREDFFEQVDTILIERLSQDSGVSWDNLHGRLGIARYFLRRKHINQLEHEIDLLYEQAIIENNEFKWISTREDKPPFYDCGMAHGHAGILYFLRRAHDLGIKKELCRTMGDGILQFYEHVKQDFEKTGSFYPFTIPVESYKNAKREWEVFSRLAWCYGDLGILHSIYNYCLSTSNTDKLESILQQFHRTASRRECLQNSVFDSMICHGAAGIVQIYNEMHVSNGGNEFREAVLHWLKVTTQISHDSSYSPPFRFHRASTNGEKREIVWDKSFSLLEGVTGVGLVLLSFLDHQHLSWSEIIMLS
jgi:lantibiotic modifying enzyme